jgi:hypothetical protein
LIGGSYAKSTMANFWSGFALAAASVASPRKNPTVTIRSHLPRKARMFGV